MTNVRARSAVALSLLVALTIPASASAQQAPAAAPQAAGKLDEARDRYEKGVKLYDESQYESARIEFERAYELAPSYRILYNLALVYQQTGDFAGALKKFQQYLAQGGAQVPEDRRAEVQRDMAKLKSRVGSLSVTVNIPDADVSVDDVPVGKSPLTAPIDVNPGRRRVSASKEGKLPTTKVIEVASSDRATIALELNDLPTQRVVIERASRRVPWVGWGVTAGATIGATVFGLLALKASSTLDDDKQSTNVTHNTLTSDAHKLRAYTITTDALGGIAIIAGAASLYYTVKWGKEDSSGDEARPAPSNEVSAGFGPGSLMVRGTF